jgi:hypothetical protein
MLNRTIEFKLYNKGLGPAILEEFTIRFIDGKSFTNPTTEQFQEILDMTGYRFKDRTVVTPYESAAISSSEEFLIARLVSDDFNKTSSEVQTKFNNISVIVKYKSIYGEKLMFDNPLCWK